MRTTRAHFKYALRIVKKQEDTARADSLARDLYDNDVDGFWKAVHKMNSCNNVQANVIDGITGQENIPDYWKEHFYKILNDNDYDHNLTADVSRKLQNVHCPARFKHGGFGQNYYRNCVKIRMRKICRA